MWCSVLASFWFDDGTSAVLLALLKAGIIDLLSRDSADNPSTRRAVDASAVNLRRAVTKAAVAAAGSARSFSVARVGASMDDEFPVSRLQDLCYQDLTVLGWVIALGKPRVMRFLVKKGYDSSVPVDAGGNSALHFVALHGTSEMVDIVLLDRGVRLEQQNSSGYTAAMLAAKAGNMSVAHRLFQRRASPRRALDGLYAGWVLAVARRKERFEKNLQTGRIGDDDETYFNVAPDPLYCTWYQPTSS